MREPNPTEPREVTMLTILLIILVILLLTGGGLGLPPPRPPPPRRAHVEPRPQRSPTEWTTSAYLRSSWISWPRFCRKLPSAPASAAITVIA